MRCNRQTLLASETKKDKQPLDSGEPDGLKTIGGGGDAQASRCALSVPSPSFVSHAQQEKQVSFSSGTCKTFSAFLAAVKEEIAGERHPTAER